jgi:hypothetical protein
MRWAPRARTWSFRGQSPAGLPNSPTAQLGASGPARTGCLPFTRRLLYLVSYEGIVSSVRFERTLPSASGSCLLPIGLRGHRSRRPVPIRTARLTKAGPQPCAAAKASGAGLEPARARVRALLGTPDAPPGTGTGGEIRTLTRPGLSRPGIPVPVTPAWCAARGSNPVFLD